MRAPLSPPRGMDDILPDEFPLHRRLFETVRLLFKLYGYHEIETPAVEYFELFAVKSGEEILRHMYVFKDAHGRQLVLRPEMTAPVARLVATKLGKAPQPIRLGYIADCYRLDEPQWGRRRRFYHGGFETFGSKSPAADTESLIIFDDFMRRVGVKEYYFKIGHVGVQRAVMSSAGVLGERQDEILALLDKGRVDEATETLRRHAGDSKPVRIFSELAEHPPGPAWKTVEDVSETLVEIAPAVRELENLRRILRLASHIIEPTKLLYYPGFARGLSYYTGFIFEVYGEGAEVALGGGGRYDGLVSLVGGSEMPGVGFAIGLTRVMQYLKDVVSVELKTDSPIAYIVPLSEDYMSHALKAASEFRRAGVPTEMELTAYGTSEAIRRAERRGARVLVMLGGREIERGVVTVKDLAERVQEEWRFEDIYEQAKTLNEKLRVGS